MEQAGVAGCDEWREPVSAETGRRGDQTGNEWGRYSGFSATRAVI